MASSACRGHDLCSSPGAALQALSWPLARGAVGVTDGCRPDREAVVLSCQRFDPVFCDIHRERPSF